MGRKIEFNRELCQMQVSRFARDFLNSYRYRGESPEPYYRALDRLINGFRETETYELQEKIRGLQHANQEYLKRIYELEAPRQMRLLE